MSSELERHRLVWLTDEGWRTVMAAAGREHRDALKLWRSQDWPAVTRRLDADAADGDICLGLPLPPDEDSGNKVRIALRVPASQVSRSDGARALREAVRSSGRWRERLAALCDEAQALDLRVYGSLGMQSLTGLPYLSPHSDVDVLFQPSDRQQLDTGVALLWRHAADLPLDGEIVFPGGQAVAWKEWRMAMAHPARVLVKDLRSVRLADTASLLAALTAREAR